MNATETIKRLLGWCPNASAPVIRKTIQFEEMTIKAPGKGTMPDHIAPKWWNKYHNWILLVSVSLMILPVKWLLLPEINKTDWMLAFISSGILYSALIAIPGFDSLNSVMTIKNKNNLFIRKTFAVSILYVLIVISYIYFASNGLERIPGYIFIFLLISWGQYIRILVWEKKNRKTIVLHGQNFVAINSGGLYGDKCN
ncbi:MAG TPA: DUF1673 family protein [Candidatus Methanoperedens sp.]